MELIFLYSMKYMKINVTCKVTEWLFKHFTKFFLKHHIKNHIENTQILAAFLI